jgi:glycosyltransferase involved in cell wall biosynthesis
MEGNAKNTPDLSVVIPCDDNASALKKNITILLGVLEQAHLNYEVMLVDDGGREDTRAVIKELCGQWEKCHCIVHEKPLGRGAALKAGFAATTGQVTGFFDIDLQVGAYYIPPLIDLIDRQGFDVATGYRHYFSGRSDGVIRNLLLRAEQRVRHFLLGLGVADGETGCKFFRRETTTSIILSSEHNGRFWDMEVMTRAVLKNLRIYEMPVLARRRLDTRSALQVFRDFWQFLVDLHRFRSKVGLGLTGKSPIYWSARGYNLVMNFVESGYFHYVQPGEVANLIPNGASVVEVCCGPGNLYPLLQAKSCQYLGLDFNGHFVIAGRKRGIDLRAFDVLSEEVPPADYVVMCSSFCHFYRSQDHVFPKLLRAARRAVIISEPIRNKTNSSVRLLGRIANRLTNPGVGEYDYRFTLEQFRAFAIKHSVSDFIHTPGEPNAIAVFNKNERNAAGQ